MNPAGSPLQGEVRTMQPGVKALLLRLALALAVAVALYFAADQWTMSVWNNEESLVVRVLEAGPESLVPGETQFQMLQRGLNILLLTGDQRGVTADITAVRLAGSGVEPLPGRRYLLVSDTRMGPCSIPSRTPTASPRL